MVAELGMAVKTPTLMSQRARRWDGAPEIPLLAKDARNGAPGRFRDENDAATRFMHAQRMFFMASATLSE